MKNIKAESIGAVYIYIVYLYKMEKQEYVKKSKID